MSDKRVTFLEALIINYSSAANKESSKGMCCHDNRCTSMRSCKHASVG